VALLALAPLAFFDELRGSHLRETSLSLTIVFGVLATLVYQLVYLLVFTALGQAGSWPNALYDVIIPTALLNVVVLVPAYALTWIASGDLRRAAYA
jgi:hypothetical protein